MPTLLARYARPWRYEPDHEGAPFGDVNSANGDSIARLMWESDALELIEYANAGQEWGHGSTLDYRD